MFGMEVTECFFYLLIQELMLIRVSDFYMTRESPLQSSINKNKHNLTCCILTWTNVPQRSDRFLRSPFSSINHIKELKSCELSRLW